MIPSANIDDIGEKVRDKALSIVDEVIYVEDHEHGIHGEHDRHIDDVKQA